MEEWTSLGSLPDIYTTEMSVSKLDDTFKHRPSIGLFSSWMQMQRASRDFPDKMNINCHYLGCLDHTYHTFSRFKSCILGRGDTIEDARRLWFGKKQFINRRDLSLGRSLVAPVPRAHAIECDWDGCPWYGMHTLGRLIGCNTTAGQPINEVIGFWNLHVDAPEQIPLSEFQEPSVPTSIEPLPQIDRDAPIVEAVSVRPRPVKVSYEIEYDPLFVGPGPAQSLDIEGLDSYEQYSEDYSYSRGSHHIRNIAAGKYRGMSEWYGQHLPGHRRPARLDCGHYQKRGHLHGDARFSHDVRLWCHERDCVTCFADGIRRFGIAATENLWGFKMACHSDVFLRKESGPLHQYVYSLGPEYAEIAKTKKGRVQNRAMLIRHMTNLGRICTRCSRDSLMCVCNRLGHIDGKCRVCAKKASSCRCVDTTYHTGGLHGGGIVYHACRFDKDCPVYGPHYHVICMGYVNVRGWRAVHEAEIASGLMCTTPDAELEKTQGVLIKRIKRRGVNPGDERNMDIESKSELGGLMYYLGTHNTKAKGEHGIVYYGTAANNKFGVQRVKCHDPTSVRKFEDWYDTRLRELTYGGEQFELVHARVQRVDIKDGENETRYDWDFGIVEVLGRNKDNLGDELFEYLTTQIKSHAYTTRSTKTVYRAPFSEYFAAMAKQAKDAGEEVDGVVTVPAYPQSKAPATPNSTPYEPSRRSIVMELTYSRHVPASSIHKEKQHVVYSILDIDPSLVGLCPACFDPMLAMIPLSGIHPRPPDVSGIGVKLDIDAEKWAMWDRSLDRGKGIPFIRNSGIIQEWGFGLLTPHPFERDLTPGLSAQVASDYVMSYARLYATYDNTTFVELYEAHLKEHQWEPDVWQWKKIRSKAIEASIANALGYLQKYNVPVCEPTYYARKYVEGGVVEAVEPMRWILNYVSSVWQWLGVNVKPSKVENLVPIDPPLFKPEYGETFTAVSMYYRGGTGTPRASVEQRINAADSAPPGTGDRGKERQQDVGVGTAGCDGTCPDPECGSYRDEELGKFLNDLEGKNGQAAKDRADYRVWEHGGGRREPR